MGGMNGGRMGGMGGMGGMGQGMGGMGGGMIAFLAFILLSGCSSIGMLKQSDELVANLPEDTLETLQSLCSLDMGAKALIGQILEERGVILKIECK